MRKGEIFTVLGEFFLIIYIPALIFLMTWIIERDIEKFEDGGVMLAGQI